MSLAEAQSLEVESPLPPARAPNMLLVSLMRQAPVMTRLYRAAEDSRVARGEAPVSYTHLTLPTIYSV